TVADAGLGRRRQVDGELRHAGTREIVDGDVVRATQGIELDLLDTVEVHGDGADIAHEAHAPMIGRDADLLRDVGAHEYERIGAVRPLDDVAAAAWIPDELVVAGAEQGRVVAAPAVDDVIAVAADQRVVSLAVEDLVVAGAAVDGELDEIGEAASYGDDVV